MEAQCVRFFVQEGLRHEGRPIHDWLFEQARAAGFTGGTAFRASAGFGRHGLREDSFFELAGQLPETVEFLGSAAQVSALLARVGNAGLSLRYVRHSVTLGVTGGGG